MNGFQGLYTTQQRNIPSLNFSRTEGFFQPEIRGYITKSADIFQTNLTQGHNYWVLPGRRLFKNDLVYIYYGNYMGLVGPVKPISIRSMQHNAVFIGLRQ
jgi:hypothetical protein